MSASNFDSVSFDSASQAQSILQTARSLFYDRALVQLDGQYVGAVAAITSKRQSEAQAQELNYNEIFMRDNVPVMIFLLLEGKSEIVRHFLDTCLKLQSNQFQTLGIFPTSFVESDGGLVADYGQRAIGRVSSVDASLWWPILAHIYVQRTGDRAWASQPNVQRGIQQFLHLILHPWFRDAPTLHVPDGAFMIDRSLDVWGAPLEIQVLLYGALLSAAKLIQLDLSEKGVCGDSAVRLHSPSDAFTQQQIHQFTYALAWVKRLRSYLLKHYWVNIKTVQVLRQRPTEQYGDEITNEYNIQTESIPHWLQYWLGDRGGYLLGNIRTGRPDFRFFMLGNCLGAMFDVISPKQQQALFQLIWHNQSSLIAQMPLRICHPPLEDTDWRHKTGFDRKNLPWCYHNGGHWPCLLWFLGVAILRHQRHHPQVASGHEPWGTSMLQSSYELLLQRLPRQKWAEYFDGPTGLWAGQQTRYYQTWTITGLLLIHHFLKVNPADVDIMNLPTVKELSDIKIFGVPSVPIPGTGWSS